MNKILNFNLFEVNKPNWVFIISNKIFFILFYLFITLFTSSFLISLFFSPTDLQQGEIYRIIYIHVPCAWLTLSIYFIITICSFFFLIFKNPIFILCIKSQLKIGILFCFITLITGALWGKPTWGTFWVWDVRLTSVLILFFIYLGLLSIEKLFSFSNKDIKIYKILAITNIIGFINLPLIKYSVEYWQTLHQGASISIKIVSFSIHWSILIPLLLIYLALTLFTIILFLINLRTELLSVKQKNLSTTLFSSKI